MSYNGILDLWRVQIIVSEGALQSKHTTWESGLSVTADGTGVIAHADSVATRLLSDRVELTQQLSRGDGAGRLLPGT